MSHYEDYEYKECIRKGKKKVVHKKQKKYEAKAQKKNRIQPLTHKIQNINTINQENTHSILDSVVETLKGCKITEWSSDYEDYYQNHHCYENDELAQLYEQLQSAIIKDEYDKYYEEYEEREYWHRHEYKWYRYDRW
jgi:tetrahydrodipicolinate N-succinyltransferase